MKNLIYVLTLMLIQTSPCFCQNSKMGGKIIENEMYTPTKSEEAKTFYNRGNDALDARMFKDAIRNFKLAIAKDTNYTDAYDNLGLAFRQAGELDSAERYYLISRRKYPRGTVAIRNLGVVVEHRQQHEKAIAYYEQALAIDAKDAEAHYGITRQYMILGKHEKAIKHARITERLYKASNSPYIGDCYLTQCVLYAMTGNKEMGRKYKGLAEEAGMTIAPELSAALQ